MPFVTKFSFDIAENGKRGKASIEAEKAIRDGGEKASGLYGAEAWCSMHGPRYDELSAKQARIEREMLGLNDKR